MKSNFSFIISSTFGSPPGSDEVDPTPAISTQCFSPLQLTLRHTVEVGLIGRQSWAVEMSEPDYTEFPWLSCGGVFPEN